MKKQNQVKLLLKLHKLEENGDGFEKGTAFKRLAKTLDPGLLKRYRKVREKKGTGVAVLKNGVCTGCKMVYPESHEVFRYKNFVHSCEYCGRLLVVLDKSA
jgi:predicted  nucleic acid-binding Zn-ribbon protein